MHVCLAQRVGRHFNGVLSMHFIIYTQLIFSDNSILYLDPKLIKYAFKKLKYFYISNNNLGHAFSQDNCMARQCSPLRRKFIECSINSPALSLLMKHLVIG